MYMYGKVYHASSDQSTPACQTQRSVKKVANDRKAGDSI